MKSEEGLQESSSTTFLWTSLWYFGVFWSELPSGFSVFFFFGQFFFCLSSRFLYFFFFEELFLCFLANFLWTSSGLSALVFGEFFCGLLAFFLENFLVDVPLVFQRIFL